MKRRQIFSKMRVCENQRGVKFEGARKLEARKLKARNLKGREFQWEQGKTFHTYKSRD